MASQIAHRGPDDAGAWGDAEDGIFLGHRRLAVQDLSSQGHQPMHSLDSRWATIFNGEIYNFQALRKALESRGLAFRGQSDTEVLLELVSQEGPMRALRAARGMFAVALWDSKDKVLHLARDRMGEKPLYYGWAGQTFLFSSELRAMHVHPAWTGRIDRAALTSYLRYNCVPAPLSIFEGIRKLGPGELLTLTCSSREPTVEHFWDPDVVLATAIENQWTGSGEAYVDQLGSVLTEAVSEQMIADVPLGAFLSGGVDSSLVVALMQSVSTRPVRTFTVGFDTAGFDESVQARKVAEILGTDHTEEYLTGEDALARVPALPACYDEPFADSSQLPTMLVAEVARRHVTVSLSGDGGDELFGGYTRYAQALARWQRLTRTPGWLRRLGAGVAEWTPDVALAAAGRASQMVRPRPVPAAGLGYRVRQRTRAWANAGLAATYLREVSFWDRPEDVLVGGRESYELENRLALSSLAVLDPQRWMRYRDARIYLPDDILTKVDRASMHVSLESRIPLLDQRVVALAWSASSELCFHDGRGKWPLRALLARYIPEDLINRPKMGFAVPLNDWLRGPLKSWAAELLEPSRLKNEGWFRPETVQLRWLDLQAGGDSHELALWSVLMFQAWKEHWASAVQT